MLRVTATAVAQFFATAPVLWPTWPSLAPYAQLLCAALESAAQLVQTSCVRAFGAQRHKSACAGLCLVPGSWTPRASRVQHCKQYIGQQPCWPMHCCRGAHAAAAQPGRLSAESRERRPKRRHRGAANPLNDAENGVHVCTSWALRRWRGETLYGDFAWVGSQGVAGSLRMRT